MGKRMAFDSEALKKAPAFAAILALSVLAGCKASRHSSNLVFESQPRPVLENIGLSSSWDPTLSVDTAGGLHLFAVYDQNSKARLGLTVSENGGDTFSAPILPITEAGVSIGSHGEQSPSVFIARSEIYALWQESGPDGIPKIVSGRSLDWGESFEAPVQVSDKGARAYRGFSSIAAAPDGGVYAVWLDERDAAAPDQDTSAVYLAKSTDRGASFANNIRVGDQTCPCCRPALAFGPNGEVFVAWRRVFSGNLRDMVVSTSYDAGKTFAPSVRVHEDGWVLQGCPDSGPTLIASNSTLWIAWMTAGSDNRARILLSRSDNGARFFRDPVLVSGEVLDPNHPAMKSAPDGSLWLVFQGRSPNARGEWNKTQAFLVHIDLRGNPSSPLSVPGSDGAISNPRIALSPGGQIFVAWTQPQADHFRIILSRGRER